MSEDRSSRGASRRHRRRTSRRVQVHLRRLLIRDLIPLHQIEIAQTKDYIVAPKPNGYHGTS